jgi:hypothetical protein
MNEFKFFQKINIYKPGDTIAVICRSYDQYLNWINEKRSNTKIDTTIPYKHNYEYNTINGVCYIGVNRPEKVRGYRFNDVIVLENAHENPFFEEINYFIQPYLVNETL